MIKELNDTNFKENIKTGLKLIEFYAPWCGYCQNSVLYSMNYQKTIFWIGIVNADENPNLVSEYKISGYPTFMLFKEGNSNSNSCRLSRKITITFKTYVALARLTLTALLISILVIMPLIRCSSSVTTSHSVLYECNL
jgi:thioredoxin 1